MQEDLFQNLIHKRLSGEINAQEAEELDAWLQASEENRAALADAELIWNTVGNLTAEPEVDLDAEFVALEMRIEADEQQTSKGGISTPEPERPVVKLTPVGETSTKESSSGLLRSRFFWSIAASIVVLALVGIFVIPRLTQTPEVQFAELTTTDSVESVTLADGTVVTLNRNSHLTYPVEMTAGRTVELEGEAFFEVTKDAAHPFKVKTLQEEVTVLGTSFNVDADPQKTTHSVTVVTGKVSFKSSKTQQEVILEPGEMGVYETAGNQLDKLAEVPANEWSWFSQELVFQDVLLPEAIQTLADHFEVELVLTDSNVEECMFSNTFSQKSLEEVLATLEVVYQLEISEQGEGSYELTGGACQ